MYCWSKYVVKLQTLEVSCITSKIALNQNLMGFLYGILPWLNLLLFSPIVLPCGHVGCLECLETFKENNKNCPGKGCKNIELPHDLRKCPADKKALLKHSQFREGLNKFFLRFLENFVFNTTQLPHGKIIEQLLEFIVHKKIKDETIKNKSTKRLSPFEVDKIDR